MKRLALILCVLLLASNAFATSIVDNVGYVGDWPIGVTTTFAFSTSDFNGVASTLTDNSCMSMAPEIVWYKDASTMQDDTGITLNPDFDGVVGLNTVLVDTSMLTEGVYSIIVSCGAVDSKNAAGATVGTFSVGRGVNLRYVNGGGTGSTAGKLELAQLKITATGSDNALDLSSVDAYALNAIATGTNGNGARFRQDVEGNEVILGNIFTAAYFNQNRNGDAAIEIAGPASGYSVWVYGSPNQDLIRLEPAGTGKAIDALGSVVITATGTANALDIIADAGSAIKAYSISADGTVYLDHGAPSMGPTLNIEGDNASPTVSISNSATGAGVRIFGGTTSGSALDLESSGVSSAVFVAASGGHGVEIQGGFGAIGLFVQAFGEAGVAASFYNNASNSEVDIADYVADFTVGMNHTHDGAGIAIFGPNTGMNGAGPGVQIISQDPDQAAIELLLNPYLPRAGGTGKAINALGQVYIAPTVTNDDAIKLVPNGNGSGINIPLNGSNATGINIVAVDDTATTTFGVNIDTGGQAVSLYSGTRPGLDIASDGMGDGFSSSAAMRVRANFSNAAIAAMSDLGGGVLFGNGTSSSWTNASAGGDGVYAYGGTDAHAINVVPNGAGHGIAGTLTMTKNTAVSAFPFVMYSSAGAPTAGLTVSCTRSLDGGAFAACANSPTGVGNGAYKIDLADTDTNGNTVILKFHATAGARDTLIPIIMQP